MKEVFKILKELDTCVMGLHTIHLYSDYSGSITHDGNFVTTFYSKKELKKELRKRLKDLKNQ